MMENIKTSGLEDLCYSPPLEQKTSIAPASETKLQQFRMSYLAKSGTENWQKLPYILRRTNQARILNHASVLLYICRVLDVSRKKCPIFGMHTTAAVLIADSQRIRQALCMADAGSKPSRGAKWNGRNGGRNDLDWQHSPPLTEWGETEANARPYGLRQDWHWGYESRTSGGCWLGEKSKT